MAKVPLHKSKGTPKNILCYMDYGKDVHTGFSTVSTNIIKELKKYFGANLKLDIVAINYLGDMYEEDDNISVYSAIKIIPERPDSFGREGFLKLLRENRPAYDGVFIINDISIAANIGGLLSIYKRELKEEKQKQFKSILYFPVDAPLLTLFTDCLNEFDHIVTYTEYGRQEVIKLNEKVRTKLRVVPHGINPKQFYPIEDPIGMDEVREFRKEYFGAKNVDKFIITNINRNNPRKDLAATILGFYEYWKNYNRNSFLYLHTNWQDTHNGYDIRAIFMQLPDLVEYRDYMLLSKEQANHTADINQMNMIYNASDAFLTTHMGEGWGLTVTEAMATRLPVIAPFNTSMMEIGADRILFLEESELRVQKGDGMIRPAVICEEVAEKLDALYKEIQADSPELERRLSNAYRYMQGLSWDNVCGKWIDYFKQVYGAQKP